jgi:MFS family permease
VRRTFFLTLYLPSFVLAFGTGMLVPVLPLYARSFGASYGMIGLALASQGIGNLIGDIPAGILLGRIGHKRAMLAGIGSLAAAVFAMAWAQSTLHLIALGLVAGLGTAMWNISRHAYMTDSILVHERGRATAAFGGFNRIGMFSGPAVGGTLATAFGLRFPFGVYGAVAIVALAAVALFVTDSGERVVIHRGGIWGHTNHLAAVVRKHYRVLGSAGLAQLLAQMIRSGRTTVVPLYAADIVGLNVTQIGWIVTLSAAIDMAMFYPAGVIMDNFGRKFSSVPSFALQALGMALIPFTFSFGTLLAATLVIGFGNGLGSGTMMTLGSDLAPKESMGEFLGVWRLIGDVGQSGAPIAVGGIADALSLPLATFAIAGAGLGAALALALFVPETLRPHKAKT